jgi:hypothetical protein
LIGGLRIQRSQRTVREQRKPSPNKLKICIFVPGPSHRRRTPESLHARSRREPPPPLPSSLSVTPGAGTLLPAATALVVSGRQTVKRRSDRHGADTFEAHRGSDSVILSGTIQSMVCHHGADFCAGQDICSGGHVSRLVNSVKQDGAHLMSWGNGKVASASVWARDWRREDHQQHNVKQGWGSKGYSQFPERFTSGCTCGRTYQLNDCRPCVFHQSQSRDNREHGMEKIPQHR